MSSVVSCDARVTSSYRLLVQCIPDAGTEQRYMLFFPRVLDELIVSLAVILTRLAHGFEGKRAQKLKNSCFRQYLRRPPFPTHTPAGGRALARAQAFALVASLLSYSLCSNSRLYINILEDAVSI